MLVFGGVIHFCCVPTFFLVVLPAFFCRVSEVLVLLDWDVGGPWQRVSDLFRLEELQDAAKWQAKKKQHQDSQISLESKLFF